MKERKEINTLEDIQLLVNSFYDKVREDGLIGDIFNSRIGDRWPEHLEKMYRFWQTVLLNERTYLGNPFMPHSRLPVSEAHFERWKSLFNATVDEFFTGTVAEDAKWRAEKMAEMFMIKINHFRNNSSTPIM